MQWTILKKIRSDIKQEFHLDFLGMDLNGESFKQTSSTYNTRIGCCCLIRRRKDGTADLERVKRPEDLKNNHQSFHSSFSPCLQRANGFFAESYSKRHSPNFEHVEDRSKVYTKVFLRRPLLLSFFLRFLMIVHFSLNQTTKNSKTRLNVAVIRFLFLLPLNSLPLSPFSVCPHTTAA